MRVVALISVLNERRHIKACLDHLFRQGVEVYLMDTGSTDGTPELAERHLGSGLIHVERIPRPQHFSLPAILRRKEELAATIQADWFIHHDADEIRLAPGGELTLLEAIQRAEKEGANAVNFLEFTFIPTLDHPDHDHGHFHDTMRWYYPFLPTFPHRLNAWKAQPQAVDLVTNAGHAVRFPGLVMYPVSLHIKHYLFLSVAHAMEKHSQRSYDPAMVAKGWHGWRARLRPEMIRLPHSGQLRFHAPGASLDPSNPRTAHYVVDRPAVASDTNRPPA